MRLVFQSSESRYQQWVDEHYRFLMRSAWALAGSRALAEDVVQDTYALAWRHRKQLRDPDLARAWLFQIMRRQLLRHCAPEPTQTLEGCEDAYRVQAPEPDRDQRMDVLAALGRLAPLHREVLVLFYFDDMSTAEMAEALEIAPGTVLSRLARAREALRLVLEPAEAGATPASAVVRPLQRRRHEL